MQQQPVCLIPEPPYRLRCVPLTDTAVIDRGKEGAVVFLSVACGPDLKRPSRAGRHHQSDRALVEAGG